MARPLTQSELNDYFIDLYEETGECLVWRGAKGGDGYGHKWHNGRVQAVHRLAWEEAYGPIHPELVVKHRCDNPACYRLDHLILGTRLGNAREAVQRGQQARGERNGAAKLTELDVLAIRASRLPLRKLAPLVGLSASAIRAVRQGKTWKHVA